MEKTEKLNTQMPQETEERGFDNYCEEVPGLYLGDGCKKVILNTKGDNDSEVEKTLVDFLH